MKSRGSEFRTRHRHKPLIGANYKGQVGRLEPSENLAFKQRAQGSPQPTPAPLRLKNRTVQAIGSPLNPISGLLDLVPCPRSILSFLGCCHFGPSGPESQRPSSGLDQPQTYSARPGSWGEALRLSEFGDRAEQRERGGGGGGNAPGKPAVTAPNLISQLQSRPERKPARVCALLTQAGKTFLS